MNQDENKTNQQTPSKKRWSAGDIISRIAVPALLAAALVWACAWGKGESLRAMAYENSTRTLYQRAASELTGDLYEMDNLLGKLQVVGSPAQYILLLDEVWRLSGSAESNLSQIPSSHVDTAAVNSFVVRVGDYARALTKKAIRGNPISEEDVSALRELQSSCRTLASGMEERIKSGDLPTAAATGEEFFAESQQDRESVQQFPTLIYDGPFSESTEKAEPKGLTGDEVTVEQAQKIAEAVAGTALTFSQEADGSIPAYEFTAPEGSPWAEVQVTRQGGSLLWYMRAASGERDGKPEQSETARYRDAAIRRLRELGYGAMQATYAQYYGGAALINCAAVQNGVILYNDLVKAWVDRETLEVIGVDARNYLFSHTERELPAPELSQSEAQAMLGGSLEVKDSALALIPLTAQTEALCYEFKCTLGGDSYILYINALTGDEEQVFQILDTEDGELVL